MKYQKCCICVDITNCCEDGEFAVTNSKGKRVAPLCETCFNIYNDIEGNVD